MENNQNQPFSYTYSAKQQSEVERIRQKYLPPEEDKMEQLRRLDQGVAKKAMAYSLAEGIVGALVMGIGMSMAMVWQGVMFVPGIIVGIIGICGVSAAYPVYTKTLNNERRKIAPEIIRLTDELMK